MAIVIHSRKPGSTVVAHQEYGSSSEGKVQAFVEPQSGEFRVFVYEGFDLIWTERTEKLTTALRIAQRLANRALKAVAA